jgi:3-hydroxyacyl-CoA dehydrogenase
MTATGPGGVDDAPGDPESASHTGVTGSTGAIGAVAVVGTGVIGASWTALFLAAGLEVTATDPAPGAEERLRREVTGAWSALTRLGLAEGASIDRLRFTTSVPEAVATADFVQESGPERIEVKHELLARIDRAAPPAAVIASSSSGLTPSELQDGCPAAPERALVGHPFNPAHLIPLVEVVPGRRTSPEAVEAAVAFYRSIGKHPIVVRRELAGHIANRLQAALWREAYWLVQAGAVSVADLDQAISNGPGLRWALLGPLANQHLSGGDGGLRHVLDHLGPATARWWGTMETPAWTEELKDLLVAGTDEALAGVDGGAVIRQRDELLELLLRAKADATDLPGSPPAGPDLGRRGGSAG